MMWKFRYGVVQRHLQYIEANKLIEEYMDTAAATDYVTQYEADYLAKKGLQ